MEKKRERKFLSWFSFAGIYNEIKRIRWSKPKELAIDSGTVIIFTLFFVVFFVICALFNAWFLNVLGV